jgi:hypothetical protein
MRNHILTIALAAILVASLAGQTLADVTPQEARAVAEAWLQYIVMANGSWGGHAEPMLGEAREIAPQGVVVGYFFSVIPIGFVVVPADKREAPAKVWSDENDLNMDDTGGMAALIRDRLVALHGLLNPPEPAAGQPAPPPPALEIDYVPTWDWLLGQAPSPANDDPDMANYAAGQVLTETRWGQDEPYNNDCPFMSCTRNANGRAVVGCVATAGAEIMRYWHWPPYGVGSGYNDAYDWVNMPTTVTTASPAAQQAAVAELSHEIGVAVGMDYGCDGSGASTADMEGVYENTYRYSTACARRDRDDYTATTWFNLIVSVLDLNRPLQYRIPGHSIVCDGWRVSGTNQYHINYGWSGTNTAWYSVDAIAGGDPGSEFVLINILPAVALGNSLSGTYALDAAFPYRYFDRDAGGTGTFSAGQNLQSLPRIVVECTSTTGGTIRFESSSSLWTRLYNRADMTRGIHLRGGTIRLRGGGGLQLQ